MAWYERVAGPEVLQGDMIWECPIIELPESVPVAIEAGGAYEVGIDICNAVVLSQSCDLANGKLERVIMCPHYGFDELSASDSTFARSKGKEGLRQGRYPALHLLNEGGDGELATNFRTVAFAQAFTLPHGYLVRLASERSPRLRLRSPYREQLSQAFARFVMRVGLPEDIPRFG